jgi:hypothetical protein
MTTPEPALAGAVAVITGASTGTPTPPDRELSSP